MAGAGIRGGFRNPLLTGAEIPDGTITGDKLADSTVPTTKLAVNLQSDNYDGGEISVDPGTVGWRIERDSGDAAFNNVVVRGTIFAETGELGDLDITGTLEMVTGGVFRTAAPADRHISLRSAASNEMQFWPPGGTHNPGTIYAQHSGVAEQLVLVSPELLTDLGIVRLALNENGPLVIDSHNAPDSDWMEVHMQLLMEDGTVAAPAIRKLSAQDGMFWSAGAIRFGIGGTEVFRLSNSNNGALIVSGTAANPGLAFIDNPNCGFSNPSGDDILVSIQGVGEVARFFSGGMVMTTTTGVPRLEWDASVAYSFQGDTDTGFRRFSANVWETFANGIVTLRSSQANGSIQVPNINTTASAANAHLTASNVLLKSTSSRRWKTAIRPWDRRNRVLELEPKLFRSTMKADDSRKTRLGLIAEEVADTFPLAVMLGDDGLPEGIDWSVITTALLAELKDLRKRVDLLESRGRR